MINQRRFLSSAFNAKSFLCVWWVAGDICLHTEERNAANPFSLASVRFRSFHGGGTHPDLQLQFLKCFNNHIAHPDSDIIIESPKKEIPSTVHVLRFWDDDRMSEGEEDALGNMNFIIPTADQDLLGVQSFRNASDDIEAVDEGLVGPVVWLTPGHVKSRSFSGLRSQLMRIVKNPDDRVFLNDPSGIEAYRIGLERYG